MPPWQIGKRHSTNIKHISSHKVDLAYLIAHPEELDQETLYDLRRLVAVYPTYHAARILFLQNLFLLHDPTFDQELRRAALLVPDRRVLFAMTQTLGQAKKTATADKAEASVVATEKPHGATEKPLSAEEKPHNTAEAASLQEKTTTPGQTTPRSKKNAKKYAVNDTTLELLDNFLDTTQRPLTKKRIKADPSTDYMSYLLQQEEDEVRNAAEAVSNADQSRLDNLIDTFIASAETGITLPEDPMMPDGILDDTDTAGTANAIVDTVETASDSAFATGQSAPAVNTPAEVSASADNRLALSSETTKEGEETAEEPDKQIVTSSAELSETLAQIYIKQHRYDRAIEVLSKINAEETTKANPYLADQMRFLQKLAKLNNGSKSK